MESEIAYRPIGILHSQISYIGVQASYAAVLVAELTSLGLSTTLLVAIYQVIIICSQDYIINII